MCWRKHRKVQTFSVTIEKENRKVDKDGNEDIIIIFYRPKFIDSTRFMASSLSNHVDNLTKKFTKLNVKTGIVFLNMKVLRRI